MSMLVCILDTKALAPNRFLPVVVKRAVIEHDIGTEPTAHNAQCASAVVTVALEGTVVKGYVQILPAVLRTADGNQSRRGGI